MNIDYIRALELQTYYIVVVVCREHYDYRELLADRMQNLF